jgi:hypothetical protein
MRTKLTKPVDAISKKEYKMKIIKLILVLAACVILQARAQDTTLTTREIAVYSNKSSDNVFSFETTGTCSVAIQGSGDDLNIFLYKNGKQIYNKAAFPSAPLTFSGPGAFKLQVGSGSPTWTITVSEILTPEQASAPAPIKTIATAAEETVAGDPLRLSDITSISQSVLLSQWAEIAKPLAFTNGDVDVHYGGDVGTVHSKVSTDPMTRSWYKVYPRERTIADGWTPEKKQAKALLQRPCTMEQKQWLEHFIAAADALAAKDAAKFKELVVPLAEDLRTML